MTDVLQGMESMGWPALAETASKLLLVMVGVGVLVMGFGVVAYAAVVLVAAIVHFGLIGLYVGRRFPVGLRFDLPAAKGLLAGGAPFLFMAVLLDVYNEIDTVMLRFFTDEAVVGWYSAANRLYRTVDMLPMVLTTALLPTLARLHSTDKDAVVAVVKKSISVGALVIVPLALGMGLLSKEIIATLPYPDSFQNSVPLLSLLALSIPMTTFLILLGTVAIAVDRQRVWAVALGATVALNVLLNLAAIPYFQRVYGNGGIGAALATLLCEGLMVVLGVWLMPKGVIDRRMTMSLLKVGVAGGVMVAIGFMARQWGLWTPVLVVVTGISYLALVLALRAVSLEEVRFLYTTALGRARRKRAAPAR
jgi:O-antigen/teichoic acid export membrane protein